MFSKEYITGVEKQIDNWHTWPIMFMEQGNDNKSVIIKYKCDCNTNIKSDCEHSYAIKHIIIKCPVCNMNKDFIGLNIFNN